MPLRYVLPRMTKRFYGFDVFISYSRTHSTPYAESLRRQLEGVGLACFLDHREIYPGAALDLTIAEAIRRSSAFVPIITEGTLDSAFVPREIAEAIRLGRQIIPISISDEIRKNEWRSIQQYRWIDDSRDGSAVTVARSGIGSEIRENFTALRRVQFRRITVSAVTASLAVVGATAFLSRRDARVQESFGLYARGIEAATRRDDHAAKMYFAKALLRNDSPEIRRALTGVAEGPRWRWDFAIPRQAGKPTKDTPNPSPRVAFSASGSFVLVAHGPRLFVLDTRDGNVRRIMQFKSQISAIYTSKSQNFSAIGDRDGTIHLFDDKTFSVSRSLFVDGEITSLALNDDSSLIGVGIAGGGMRVLDLPSGEEWFRSPSGQHEQTVEAMSFAPASSRMIWSMSRWLYATDPVSGYFQLIAPQNDVINSVAWDRTRNIVAAAGLDGPIQLLNQGDEKPGPAAILSTRKRATPALQELSGHRDGVTAMAFTGPRGTLASVGYDAKLQLWDISRAELRFSVSAHAGPVTAIAVSPDDRFVATVGRDLRVRVWQREAEFGKVFWLVGDLRNDDTMAARSGGNNIDAIAALSDRSIVVGHSGGSITEIGKDGFRSIKTLQQVMPRSPFLKKNHTGDKVIAVSPSPALEMLRLLSGGGIELLQKVGDRWSINPIKIDAAVVDAAWSDIPDTIVIVSADGSLSRGRIQDGTFSPTRSIKLDRPTRPAFLVVATKTDVSAVGFDDGSVVVVRDGQQSSLSVGSPLSGADLSPDGAYLVTRTSGISAKTVIRDLQRDKVIAEIEDWIGDVAFDPASKLVAYGSDPKGEISVHDLSGKGEIARWKAHGGGVRRVSFDLSGRFLFSAGNDGVVRRWPVEVIDRMHASSPADVYGEASRSTGVDFASTGEVRPIPPADAVKLDQPVVEMPAPRPPTGAESVRAALRSKQDKDLDVSLCGTLESYIPTDDMGKLSKLALAAACAKTSGRDDAADAAHSAFYDAVMTYARAVEQGPVWPGLDFGVAGFVDRAAASADIGQREKAARILNLAFLRSWSGSSLVRLPPGVLLQRYSALLGDGPDEKPDEKRVAAVAERAREFADRIEPAWADKTVTVDELEAVPRLLSRVAEGFLAAGNETAAWTRMDQSAELGGKVVEVRMLTGDRGAPESRRFWARSLAYSASLACHVVAQAAEKGPTTPGDQTIGDIGGKAAKAYASAVGQWEILNKDNAMDEETRQAFTTLRSTLRWCGSDIFGKK